MTNAEGRGTVPIDLNAHVDDHKSAARGEDGKASVSRTTETVVEQTKRDNGHIENYM